MANSWWDPSKEGKPYWFFKILKDNMNILLNIWWWQLNFLLIREKM
ncbi:MAG: hypothetical protein JJE45_00765 [Prolixibacteraceae bacterium]|nr:hypothetical protein [Prolixibacteraceae bacterium]